jgi:hypothetical protein
MPEYPETVITHDRKGNKEVRWLVDKGKFVRYQYRDPASGKLLEKGKFSLLLKNRQGKEEHFYLIPIQNRFLAIPLKEAAKKRKVWDGSKKKVVGLF